MVAKDKAEIIGRLIAKYDQRQRKARWLIADDYGKPGEAMPSYYNDKPTNTDNEFTRDKIFQTKNKSKITLPKVKW